MAAREAGTIITARRLLRQTAIESNGALVGQCRTVIKCFLRISLEFTRSPIGLPVSDSRIREGFPYGHRPCARSRLP